MNEVQRVDPKMLGEALSFFRDEFKQTYEEKHRQEIEGLVKKWGWFLGEDVLGRKVKPISPKQWPMMAMLLENFMNANPQHQDVFEATVKSVVSLPVKWALPIIRDVFPSLILNRVCSIQPMPPASGGTMQLFWMHFYREDKNPEEILTTNDCDYPERGENAVPKRIRMKVTSESVNAVKRILAATWSTEVEEDARGALGIDVEAELVNEMGVEILRAIEQEILQDMLTNATAGNVNWSWTAAAGYTDAEWFQTLGHKLIDAERLVRVQRHRRCQYIICGLRFEAYLRKMSIFNTTAPRDPDGPIQSGVEYIGNVNGLWDVYSTPYINQDRAIMSYYPEGVLHAGYIFAPYIPLTPMEKIYAEMAAYNDQTLPGALTLTDKWTRAVRTRFALKYCQPLMFATLSISA